MINKGYAERVPDSCIEPIGSRVWYIPHHGVFHPEKPEKIRVVYDCSAEYMGESLNKNLLQGPDLTNALVGVLCRFRKDYIPVMCDIEKMFFKRVLGVQWSVESDSFQFRTTLSDQPFTRRGVLSTVNSIYDPLGFISPVVLVGKQILQHLCADRTYWDEPIPEHLSSKWEKRRRTDIFHLKELNIRRCFKPSGFGNVVSTELHHFSYASQSGYGQCSYLKLVDDKQQVHCTLVMSKSRVAPLKTITIPRLELTAAVVSVKISDLIQRELDFRDVVSYYWTDSKVVLGYIANDSRRFQVFVANRVQMIHDHTELCQWRYVDTKANPADSASRGASVDQLLNQSEWFSDPHFLWQLELPTFSSGEISLQTDDKELRKVQSFSIQTSMGFSDHKVSEHFGYFSSWNRLKRAVAFCFLYVSKLRKSLNVFSSSQNNKSDVCQMDSMSLSVSQLEKAEHAVIKVVQSKHFSKEIQLLKGIHRESASDLSNRQAVHECKTVLRSKSTLYRLDPFLGQNGILGVGGRLQHSKMPFCLRNPVILPKESHVTNLLVRHFHNRVNHQGRGMTSNEIKANGYWIVSICSAAYRLIDRCVTCRKLRGYSQVQKMADLSKDRLDSVPPFTYCGVDYFGPWYIREGRKDLKRYGVIFTCLCCRAVHLEVANSVTTDSFINALRRFIAIRGPIRELRSDRGSNFVGAERVLKESLAEMDVSKVERFLLSEGCDYIEFKMNVPHASHMGGVWERQIRSVRNVLAFLLYQHGQQLDDESLRTFMCEVSSIINSRPLSAQNLNDAKSVEPLTPNHLLMMKSKLVLPPPGYFQKGDLYCRRRWGRIQYLANEFWSRWRKEYVQNLQVRQKWIRPVSNCCIGDIVLIVDECLPRNQWRMGRITEVTICTDDDGLVRKVKLLIGTKVLDSKGCRKESVTYLERSIHKLVLLYNPE
ncbi:uncharacterized protein LOC128555836 [Mercenaria mercenaria]|uniref:uncharacterized protein LOC128555836 n=1 Tax=Mercenaria mercenaria TaxID=6596 RepID=UPI00234EE40D|nr:uncharacterized protein LOC128555836 [Mercenaria mercenaria]